MKLKDESKKIAINQKTLDLVFEKGIAGIKMADLARKVGISPSTLYVYYKSKEDLIVSLFAELMQEQTIANRSQLALDLPYKLKLKKVWLHWLNFSINNFKEMNFIEQVKHSPYYDKVPTQIKEDKLGLRTELFNSGKEQQILKNIDNLILEGIAWATLVQTTTLILNKELDLNEKNTEMMFGLLWDAIKS